MNGRLKLLLIYPVAISNTFFSRMALLYQKAGIEVCIATNTDVPATVGFPEGAQVIHVGMSRGMDPQAIITSVFALRKVVKEVKPDLVHVNFSAGVFLAGLACRKDWPPMLGTFHGMVYPYEEGLGKYLYAFAERFGAARVGNVVLLTKKDMSFIQRDVPSARTFMAGPYGLGIDLERFDPARFTIDDRLRIRAKFGFGEKDVVAVFVGRMEERKGFHLAVRGFRRLRDEFPEARLMFVGQLDSHFQSGLTDRELAWARECKDIAWGGVQTDVAMYLQAADFMVLPTYRDGMPLSIMEAMAMGLPCLTTNASGPDHQIENEVDGIKVPPRSLEALIPPWRKLIADEQYRKRLGRAAAAKRELFDYRVSVEEYIKLYRKLVEESGGPR